MDERFLLRREHIEFSKRIEEDHDRMKARIKNLEVMNKQINELVVATNAIALSVKNLTEAQKIQNSRLESLEARDGEKWRKLVNYLFTTIVGIILGLLANKLRI